MLELLLRGRVCFYINWKRFKREAMIGPYGIGHEFTRKTEAFQARHLSWYFHDDPLNTTAADDKLAMPWLHI